MTITTIVPDKKNTKTPFPTRSLFRGLSASVAGLRAGGAIALDSARQKITGSTEQSDFVRQEARRFAHELGKLKGSYVKIGQMLALFGEHFLPAVLADALHELEDNTQPIAWSQLEASVRATLGSQYQQLLIDPQPVAAASLAQVHKAKIIETGETICLKIQYPGLASTIDADFDAVIGMLKAARWLSVGRELDAWLSQMRYQLHNELDYVREAQITIKMRETLHQQGLSSATESELDDGSMLSVAAMDVPNVYLEYSTKEVLALTFIEGYSIKHPDVQALPLAKRNELGLAMLNLFFYEVFEWGMMQADPNFGNYLVEIDRQNTNLNCKLISLDFGSSLELTQEQRENLKQVIQGGLVQDAVCVEQGLRGLGWLSNTATEEAVRLFVKFCYYLLEPLRPVHEQQDERLSQTGQYQWGQSNLMQRVGKQGLANATTTHFEMPSNDFSLFARKLTGVFTFIAYLDAEFNAAPLVKRFLAQAD